LHVRVLIDRHRQRAVGVGQLHRLEFVVLHVSDTIDVVHERHIHLAGPHARVYLEALHDATELEAHLSQEEMGRLQLKPGQTIYALPRRLDVFPDYVI